LSAARTVHGNPTATALSGQSAFRELAETHFSIRESDMRAQTGHAVRASGARIFLHPHA
jgi:hypothetical protein